MKKSKLPLIITFLLTVVSGIFCHVIKDGAASDHSVWVRFQIFHIIVSVAFLVFTFKHIKPFKKWYAKWDSKALQRKSKNTVFVSLVLALLICSGIALLLIEGGGSSVGLWHYRLGLIFVPLCGWHGIKRLRTKFKGRLQPRLR